MTFDEAIFDLELVYADVLNRHINIITGNCPDSLDNHFRIVRIENAHQILFNKNTYLSLGVQSEINSAFILYYSND